MQSHSNVVTKRLPEGLLHFRSGHCIFVASPILGFYANVRNVSHTTFRHCRVCTLVLVNLSRNRCIYNRDYICVRVFGDSVSRRKSLPGSVAGHSKDRHGFKNRYPWGTCAG